MKRNLVCAFAAIATSACAPDSAQETAISQRVVAGQAAYLAIAPHKACVSVEPVSESEGRKLLSRTVFMKVLH